MIKEFFYKSDDLDHMTLRPLSHIKPNWELTWDSVNKNYLVEENSYAEQLNHLINEMEAITPPKRYHDNEDILAEYVIKSLKWDIKKIGNRWTGDYPLILEQGGFKDVHEHNLISASVGRIHAAIKHGQKRFDDMEVSHKEMLASVIAIILYH